jgi:hypothetical protein
MGKSDEYTLIVYGNYQNVDEAKNALQIPFIEDYVEEHGKFLWRDFDNIKVAKGITLGQLEIAQIGIETFEISCLNPHLTLNKSRIDELADLLTLYDMFDEIEIKPKIS